MTPAGSALVLVHCQVGFLEGGPGTGPVHDAGAVRARLVTLLDRAREAGTPVVFLEEVSEPGIDGPIAPELAPAAGEVVVRTNGPDVFGDAHLGGVLEAVGATHVVVAGFQTEVCVEAVVSGAVARGIGVTLVGDAHSTFDADGEAPAAQVIAAHNEELGSVAAVAATRAVRFYPAP